VNFGPRLASERPGSIEKGRPTGEEIVAGVPLFGFQICGARGFVRWPNATPGRRPYRDFDAAFFFHVLGFPLVPFRAAHVFRHTVWDLRRDCEWHPIRWSASLVALAWVRRATLVLAAYAVPVLAFAALALAAKNDPDARALIRYGVAVIAGWAAVWWLLRLFDRRNREIRTIVGNSRFGSGDPATYDPAWVAKTDFATARPLYGTETFGEGAANCVKMHNWWGAMFAARLCLLLEDRELGRQLTQAILNEPEVRDALREVRADPARWHALLGPGRYQSS
jgi:hypothetical protein